MLTFIVSHESELVSSLVALCLHFYHGRNVRIFVVNVLDRTRVQNGVTPWCGVSTISNFRGNHWEFIRDRILYGVLRSCLIPLDNIRLSDSPSNRSLKPDFPVGSQQSIILASASDFGAHTGLFYHPEILIQTLKVYLAQSSNVSFTSVVSQGQVLLMVRNIGGDIVWVNCVPTQTISRIANFDMLIQSKLSSFIPLASKKKQQIIKFPVQPSNVLWIPLLRAILGLSTEPILRSQKLQYGNVKIIDVFTGTNVPIINETNQRYDLWHCLRICGYVLDCVGEVTNITPKL